MKTGIESLQQAELVVVRRLRNGPMTEFELAHEIAEHSGFSGEDAADRIGGWLLDLQQKGLVWAGSLSNARGQSIMAAALTAKGKDLTN